MIPTETSNRVNQDIHGRKKTINNIECSLIEK